MGRLFEQLPLFVLVRICNLVGPSIALLTAQAGDGLAPLHHRVDLVTTSSVFSNKEEFYKSFNAFYRFAPTGLGRVGRQFSHVSTATLLDDLRSPKDCHRYCAELGYPNHPLSPLTNASLYLHVRWAGCGHLRRDEIHTVIAKPEYS